MSTAVKVGNVIYVKAWSIGNPRSARVRVESVESREQREYQNGQPTGGSYTIWTVRGIEVVKADFSPRLYFGKKLSHWGAYLKADDFEVIG